MRDILPGSMGVSVRLAISKTRGWTIQILTAEEGWTLGAVADGRVYLHGDNIEVLTGTTESPTEPTPQTSTRAETTTDGPGFGVLTTVVGVGLFAWRSLTNR